MRAREKNKIGKQQQSYVHNILQKINEFLSWSQLDSNVLAFLSLSILAVFISPFDSLSISPFTTLLFALSVDVHTNTVLFLFK